MGERLHDWMDARKITDRALAAELNYSRTLVWKIRTGQRRESARFMLRFARRYGGATARELFPDFPGEEVTA